MKFLAIWALLVSAVFANDVVDLVQDNTRKTLKLKTELYRAKADSSGRKMMLEDLAQILSEKIKRLDQALREFKSKNTNALKIKNDLIVRKLQYEKSIAHVNGAIENMQTSLLEIVDALPPVFREELAKPLGTLKTLKPKDLSKRLTTILGITSQINTYIRRINVFEEVKQVGGQDVRIKTLYLGVSYGYFYNKPKMQAGIIKVVDGRWTYKLIGGQESENLVDMMDSVLDIKSGKKMAQFVDLPLY